MFLQIVMEYCGGGSVADLMNTSEEPLEEYQIAFICREALKVLLSGMASNLVWLLNCMMDSNGCLRFFA